MERQTQTLALRGSDNQRLTLLSDLGRARLGGYARPRCSEDKTLDILFDAEGIAWLAGIPERGDLYRLRELLQLQGYGIVTSADTRTYSSMNHFPHPK